MNSAQDFLQKQSEMYLPGAYGVWGSLKYYFTVNNSYVKSRLKVRRAWTGCYINILCLIEGIVPWFRLCRSCCSPSDTRTGAVWGTVNKTSPSR